MTIDTSGSGLGRAGEPPTLTFQQFEQSAKSQFNHINLFVMGDLKSADTPIAFWNPVERHRTSADRPTLPKMSHTRITEDLGGRPERDKQPLTQELLNFLPPDVLTRLMHFRKLPFGERDPAYVALDNALSRITDGAFWLEGVTSTELNADDVRLAAIYQNLPNFALSEAEDRSRFVLEKLDQNLGLVGPNNPYFDKVLQFRNELEEVLDNPTLERVQLINEQLDGIDIGPFGNVLRATFDTLEMVLENDTPLSFGLALALKEMDLGKDLETVIQGVVR